MQTRSQSLFPSPVHAASGTAPVGLRRGAWQPQVSRQPALQPARVDAASGRPARELLRGLVAWLQRARALNSQVL